MSKYLLHNFLIILIVTYISAFPFEKIPEQFSIPLTIHENTPLAYLGYQDGTNYQYTLIDINSRYSWTNSSIIKGPLYCDRIDHSLIQNNYKLEGEYCIDRIEFKNKKEILTIDDFQFILSKSSEGKLPDYPVINFGNFKRPYILEFNKKGKTGNIILNTNFYNFRHLGLIKYFQKIPIIKNEKESWKFTSHITGIFIGELDWNNKKNTEFAIDYNIGDKVAEKIFSIKNKYKNIKVDLNINLETAKKEIYLPKNVFDWIVENFLSNKFCEFSKDEVRCKKNKVGTLKKLNFIFSNNVTLFTEGENFFECSNSYDKEFCKFLIVPKNENDDSILGFTFLKNYYIYIDKNQNEVAFRGFQFKSNIDLDIKPEVINENNTKSSENKETGKLRATKKSTDNKKIEDKKVNKKDDKKEDEKKQNLYGSIKSFLAICIIFAITFLVLYAINKCKGKKNDGNKDDEVELVDTGGK